MTDTLRNMPRYIRNTDSFGWQGADGPNGPWRSIAPPQNGTPWQTTNPMDDLRQASADVSGVELEPGWRMTAAVPTKDEAVALYSEVMAVHNCQTLGDMAEHFARAALSRWGRPAAAPVPVSERLPEPNTKVLAHYFNALGKGRTICAVWVPAKSRSDDADFADDDFTEYDEEDDKFYWPEGWYEAIENWDELGWVKVDEGEIAYWQPLPKWPANALPLPAVEVE